MATPRKPSTASAKERARRASQSAEDTTAAAALGTASTRRQTPTTAPPRKPSGASAFRERALGEDLLLPSGLVCRARRVGMEALLSMGKIPNMLLPIVEDALNEGRAGRELSADKFRQQVRVEHLGEIMAMFDDITVAIVSEPPIRSAPYWCRVCHLREHENHNADIYAQHERELEKVPDELRPVEEDGVEVAYVDWVDLEDKVFLFNYAVGGSRDIERFRTEQAELVAQLSTGEGV